MSSSGEQCSPCPATCGLQEGFLPLCIPRPGQTLGLFLHLATLVPKPSHRPNITNSHGHDHGHDHDLDHDPRLVKTDLISTTSAQAQPSASRQYKLDWMVQPRQTRPLSTISVFLRPPPPLSLMPRHLSAHNLPPDRCLSSCSCAYSSASAHR